MEKFSFQNIHKVRLWCRLSTGNFGSIPLAVRTLPRGTLPTLRADEMKLRDPQSTSLECRLIKLGKTSRGRLCKATGIVEILPLCSLRRPRQNLAVRNQ
jgi:hypothetical protein